MDLSEHRIVRIDTCKLNVAVTKLSFLGLALLFASSIFAAECDYGGAPSCPAGSTCVNYDKETARCVEDFSGPLKYIQSPYGRSTRFVCDQGPLSPKGNSHTWTNTAHALDLKSVDMGSAAPLFAAADGEVIAYSECNTTNDQCGAGFGNHVKILGADGYLYFYSHLLKVSVATGDRVKKAQRLGLEGMTGWTGENNPHLHMSVHFDWRQSSKDTWKNLGWLPPAVPFELSVCESPNKCTCKAKNTPIKNLSCRRNSNTETVYCGGN